MEKVILERFGRLLQRCEYFTQSMLA